LSGLINGTTLKLTALYLYREHDQEIGFKENPSLRPLVFTWKKPIYTCFNMVNVPYDLEIFFFNADKKIIGSAVMEKFSQKQYCHGCWEWEGFLVSQQRLKTCSPLSNYINTQIYSSGQL